MFVSFIINYFSSAFCDFFLEFRRRSAASRNGGAALRWPKANHKRPNYQNGHQHSFHFPFSYCEWSLLEIQINNNLFRNIFFDCWACLKKVQSRRVWSTTIRVRKVTSMKRKCCQRPSNPPLPNRQHGHKVFRQNLGNFITALKGF